MLLPLLPFAAVNDPEQFFIIKGALGVLGTALLLIYMNAEWSHFDRDDDGIPTGIGQRLRFMCLFGFAVLVTGASYEQVQDATSVINKRNIGALALAVFLIFTMVVTIMESKAIRSRRRH